MSPCLGQQGIREPDGGRRASLHSTIRRQSNRAAVVPGGSPCFCQWELLRGSLPCAAPDGRCQGVERRAPGQRNAHSWTWPACILLIRSHDTYRVSSKVILQPVAMMQIINYSYLVSMALTGIPVFLNALATHSRGWHLPASAPPLRSVSTGACWSCPSGESAPSAPAPPASDS